VRRVLIMGAAGRDFHNFNVVFRDDPEYLVVAFTAAQIPGIIRRVYPASLAGPRYREGIPIVSEHELTEIVQRERVDVVVLAYSDLTHEDVMHRASIALAAGADFTLLGPRTTMVHSRKTANQAYLFGDCDCRSARDHHVAVLTALSGDIALRAWRQVIGTLCPTESNAYE
jgi:predicted GTPase